MTRQRVTLADYIDKNSAAAKLGVNPRTLDRWAALRTGPPRVKAGRRVLYRESAILDWLRRQEQPPAATPAGQR